MPANNNRISTQDLLALIGQQITYQQQSCEIVELLDDCQFVLQVLNDESSIQATQYGEGHRKVPKTHVVPIFDGHGKLHPELLAAGLQAFLPQ